MKVLGMLVPKELKVDHGNPASQLSDETLALMIGELESRIANRLSGESPKLINAQAEPKPREKQPFGEAGWRKKNPKTPPAQLEKARERARRLAEVRKAKRAAEVADAEAKRAGTTQAQASLSDCAGNGLSLPSSDEDQLE